MLDWNAKIWVSFAAIMGVVVGGTITWLLGIWAPHDAATLVSLLVAIFTAVLAVSTIGLWTDTRLSTERQLRACLSVIPFEANNIVVGQVPVVKCNIVNHGVTPAKEIIHQAGLGIIDYPLPPGVSFAYTGTLSPLVSKPVLHHGQDIDFSASPGSLLLSEADFLAITTRSNRRLYVAGRVAYRDAFGRDRETKFCYSIVPSPTIAQAAGGPVSVEFSPADRENDWT
jgi:hypothetical protein